MIQPVLPLTKTGKPSFDVLVWRYDELRRAGYPADVAAHLAEAADVDLHQACELLRRGAKLEQALAILD